MYLPYRYYTSNEESYTKVPYLIKKHSKFNTFYIVLVGSVPLQGNRIRSKSRSRQNRQTRSRRRRGGGGSFTLKPVDSFFIVVFAELINMLETFLYIYLCYRYLFIEVHDGQKINIWNFMAYTDIRLFSLPTVNYFGEIYKPVFTLLTQTLIYFLRHKQL